jgi:hypothetical protein
MHPCFLVFNLLIKGNYQFHVILSCLQSFDTVEGIALRMTVIRLSGAKLPFGLIQN